MVAAPVVHIMGPIWEVYGGGSGGGDYTAAGSLFLAALAHVLHCCSVRNLHCVVV